jgi:cytochrome c553
MDHPCGRKTGIAVWTAATLCCLTPSSLPAGDMALGRHLAGECTTCHPRGNRAAGIPAIVGWPPDQFVAVLQSYRAKERDNQVMQSVASSLSDDEMAALAEYFAVLKPGG